MSMMNELLIDLQQELNRGQLTFEEIADKFKVPMEWVDQAWDMLLDSLVEDEERAWQRNEEREPDAFLDADYESRYEMDPEYLY